MMRAVAVPYIIALILGVAVIGLVGYWFVTTGGKFGGQSAKTICDNKFLQWCITQGGGKFTDFVKSNTECTGLGSYTDCSEFGSSGGGTGSPQQPPQTECIPNGQQCGLTSLPCCNSPPFSCKVEQSSQIQKCLP